jgi:4-carboxymuconolactone decarboxylase
MAANYTPEEIQKAHEILYNEGIKMRYQVAGKEYVDKSLAAAQNPFAKAMQEVRPLLKAFQFSCSNTPTSM